MSPRVLVNVPHLAEISVVSALQFSVMYLPISVSLRVCVHSLNLSLIDCTMSEFISDEVHSPTLSTIRSGNSDNGT